MMNKPTKRDQMNAANRQAVERKMWIDTLKLVAILGVIANHTQKVLYETMTIMQASLFCVTLFVLANGITSYASNKHRMNEPYLKYIGTKLKKVFLPYVVISLMYIYFNEGTRIDLEKALITLLSFSASGPMYYLFIYLQLILIGRAMTMLVDIIAARKYSWLLYIVTGTILYLFSFWNMVHTIVPHILLANFLFGGTYLFVFYIGMLFGRFFERIKLNRRTALLTLICSLAFCLCWLFFVMCRFLLVDNKVDYFTAINPPGLIVIIYAVFILIIVWSLDAFVQSLNSKVVYSLRRAISSGGAHIVYLYVAYVFHEIFKYAVVETVLSCKYSYQENSISVDYFCREHNY